MDITNTQNNKINTETAVADLGTEQVASLTTAKPEASGWSGKQIQSDSFVSIAPTTQSVPTRTTRPVAQNTYQAKLAAEKSVGSACSLAPSRLGNPNAHEVAMQGIAYFDPTTGKVVMVKWEKATGIGSDYDGLSEDLAATAERLIKSRATMPAFPEASDYDLGNDTAALIPVPFHVVID